MQNHMDQLSMPQSWQAFAEQALVHNVLTFQRWQNFWLLPFFEMSLMPLALLSLGGGRSEHERTQSSLRLLPPL